MRLVKFNMRTMSLAGLLHYLLIFTVPEAGQAQPTFTTNSTGLTVTGYAFSTEFEVIVPEYVNDIPVTAIGTNAFYFCNMLNTVTIPPTVTCIQDGAFGHCTQLQTVVLPPGLTSIGTFAFSDCEILTNFVITGRVINIETKHSPAAQN